MRVEGILSRVEGKISRVEGKLSRVVFLHFFFFSFGHKISRLSGIYRNANMLNTHFLFSAPLISLSRVWGTSACDLARLFPLLISLTLSLAFSLACFACYKFRLFGFVFF